MNSSIIQILSKHGILKFISAIAFLYIIFTFSLESSELKDRLSQEWRWVKYDAESGLPSDRVLNLLRSKDGTMWALTSKGLAWFDGFIWRKLDRDFNFQAADISFIVPDNNNGLIIVENGGLLFVGKDKFIRKNVVYGSDTLEVHEAVVFHEDTLMLRVRGLQGHKLCLFTNRIIKFIGFPEKLDTKQRGAYLLRKGDADIYVSGISNLYRFSNTGLDLLFRNRIESQIEITPIKNESVNQFSAWIFYPLNLKGYWSIGADSLPQKIFESDQLFQTADISPDKDAIVVYFSGMADHVNKYGEVESLGNISFLQNAERIRFSDDGNLWVATNESLYLCRLNSQRWTYWKNEQELRNHINEIIRAADGSIWIATTYGIEQHKPNGEVEIIKNIGSRNLYGITSIADDNEGNIWISSGSIFKGVYKYDGRSWTFYNSKNGFTDAPVHKIRKDKDGNLWFLTLCREANFQGHGAYRLKNGKFEKWGKNKGLFNNRVYDFTEGPEPGVYWFATRMGVARWKDGKWTVWDQNNGVRSDLVYCVELDKNGRLWFSDKFNGPAYIENDKVFYPDEFNDANIFQVLEIKFDKNNWMWLSTNSGLFRYSDGLISDFSKKSGLATNASWPLMVEDSMVFAGTFGSGVNILRFSENSNPYPKVYIDEPAVRGGDVSIEWKVFAWKGQQKPEEIKVRYRIDDGQWSDWSKQRDITLGDLGPGEYKFYIQAANLFGQKSEAIKEVTIFIPYPIYLRPEVVAPFTLLFLILVLLIIMYIRKKNKNEEEITRLNKDLEKRVSDRTAQLKITLDVLKEENKVREKAEMELREAKEDLSKAYEKEKELSDLKSSFIDMISHEYRTPLTIIMSSGELIKLIAKKYDVKEIDAHVEKIRKAVDVMTKMLEDTLLFSKRKQGDDQFTPNLIDLSVFCHNIIREAEVIDTNKHKFIFKNELQNNGLMTDAKYLHHLLINLLVNASKYSKENSEVILEASDNDEIVELRVIDNGKGISERDRKHLFDPFHKNKKDIGLVQGTGLGLAIVKNCVDTIGGSIDVETKIGEGTTFIITLPRKDNDWNKQSARQNT